MQIKLIYLVLHDNDGAHYSDNILSVFDNVQDARDYVLELRLEGVSAGVKTIEINKKYDCAHDFNEYDFLDIKNGK